MIAGVLMCSILGGLVFALMQGDPANQFWLWLDGTLIAASLAPVLLSGPQPLLRLFAALWAVPTIVGAASLSIEAAIFLPMPPRTLLTDLAMKVLAFTAMAAVLAGARDAFRVLRPSSTAPAAPGDGRIAGALFACGAVYLALYFIAGGVFYMAFTRPYYEDPALGLTAGDKVMAGLGWWFPAIQFGRGMLMAGACLPIVVTLRANRRALSLTLAAALWVAGGLAPLVVPNPHMPPLLRLYHTLEILLQNAPVGLLAGRLLGRREEPLAAEAALGSG